MIDKDLQGVRLSPNMCWPLPFSGLPGLMNGAGLMLVALGPAVSLLGDLGVGVPLLGIALLLLSVGRRVDVRRGALHLYYGYPVPAYKQVVREVVDLADLRRLKRGRLAKYFKLQVAQLLAVALTPLAYLAARGVEPPPEYAPLLLVPVVVCTVLVAYFALTMTDYLRFVRHVFIAVGSLLTVLGFYAGMAYRAAYGRSMLEDPHAVTVFLVGVLLLAGFLALVQAFAVRGAVIVVEDSRGKHYAVATSDDDAARVLVNLIAREVMARGEDPA